MSLNQLVDNVIQIARNSNVVESEHLSRIQVEKWIMQYRLLLLKQEIEKKKNSLDEIDDMYLTTIEPIHLDRTEPVPGYYQYVGDKELPKLINFHNRVGVVNVRDMFGNLIQLGSRTKAKYQKYRKATCKDYIAWVKDNKIYVDGDSNQLEYISVDVLAEDPSEIKDCFDPDAEFPLPADKIPVVTQMIFENELKYMLNQPSDESNNSHDDLQNVIVPQRSKRRYW